MPRKTIDHTGVDPTQTVGFPIYEGETPRPGIYNAEIRNMRVAVGKDSGNEYYKIVYIIGPDAKPDKSKYQGCPVFDNVVPGKHELQILREAQLMKAISGKTKAVVDYDEVADGGTVNKVGGKVPEGTKVQISVRRETYKDDIQLKVTDVFAFPKDQVWPEGAAAKKAAVLDEEEEEETEDAAEEEEETEDAAEEEEEEEAAEEEAEEEEDDEYTARVEEIKGLDRVAIKAALKATEDKEKILKSTTDDDLRLRLLVTEYDVEENPFVVASEDSDEEPPF